MKRIMLSSSTSFLAGGLGADWDTALLLYKCFLYTGMEIQTVISFSTNFSCVPDSAQTYNRGTRQVEVYNPYIGYFRP